ncbi:alanine/glycine:cation symporter family protein [Murimonas intestini]|uniref:AGCS family alanine or glycine:cation symporter n=1 Tax=Murimonas intestini TaxID=1337051 RepID=A0AB73T6V4_9FIRM|nr:sodium:alanine symporter family protein [Murimonas intestini]MCR1841401.1 sodium:alanine symporter family protein [Murimonas intestini]MCR1866319.1 sodium:alanine symporter family protein [Murimonas intestini]MCR1882564.1 sodium:alanine symporter family protein [Murimonas intestini]
MDRAAEILRNIDNIVWGPFLLLFMLGTGIYLTVKMRFLPLRNLGYALKSVVTKDPNAKEGGKGDISSFSSLMTELAATIGTGNIVGVATAMVLGGPGALIWMMVSALIGLATKFAESTLSVKYRTVNANGEISGGPMYTMQNAFPNKKAGKALGCAFALFAVFASFGMGNMTQSNSISSAVKETFGVSEGLTGLIVTILSILVILGGIKAISKVTQIVVPCMAVFYMAGAVAVIFMNIGNLPSGIWQIVSMAFSPRAMAGGAGGTIVVSMQQALRWGVSRGVFSNEAGLGAAGISAAAANTDDPVRQGYISMTGVFFDTIVICSVTGLALAASGVIGITDASGELVTGSALTIAAFATTFGEWGGYLVCIGIVLFAFATIIGWEYQGEKAFEFLVKKPQYCIYYRFVYALTAFVGATCALDVVWDFSDIMNGLMAIPNLICVLVLSGTACNEIFRYEKNKRNNK